MSEITRRRLLESSLLAALAAVGGSASGATEPSPRPRRRAAPNDRIRVACIGLNGRGMAHVEGYLGHSDAELVALCDCDTDVIAKAQAAVEKKGHPKPQGVQDLRRIFDDKNIDAVSIATPNHWHSLAAIWAMQAGKDVYVEKPVSHNVSEGRRTVETARKYNRICQAGTQSRSHKAMQEAMDYIHSGKIGKVTLARALCYKPRNSIGKVTGPQPVPPSVNYDLWLGPAPEKPPMRQHFHYDWHWFWDYGNGDLGNQGIHQMDIARWALNKHELPGSVFALGGRFGYEDSGETPNTELCFFDYGDSHLIFEVRGLKTEPLNGVKIGDIVYGTEGVVVMSDNYGKAVALDNQGNTVQTFTGSGDHFGNFLSAVRSRNVSDLHADIEEGHLSSALCHLGNISYRLGRPTPFQSKPRSFGDDKEIVETLDRFDQHLAANGVALQQSSYQLGPKLALNPPKEEFAGNHAANALLTRHYRKPYVVPAKA
jgi:predicted dehydrogenase